MDIVLNSLVDMSSPSLLNTNFTTIMNCINGDVLHLSGGNNVMSQDLDMNGHTVMNFVSDPNKPNSLVARHELDDEKATRAAADSLLRRDLDNVTISAVQPGSLAAVAFSGSYTDLINTPTYTSGGGGPVAWTDIQGKPIFSTVATTGAYTDLAGRPALFSGSYLDLSNKPNLGTAAGMAFTDFATSVQGAKADAALPATANAVSASKLATPRAISGVPFDGTGDITIPTQPSTSVPTNIQSGSSYILQASDAGKEVQMTSDVPNTVVVPDHALPQDAYVLIRTVGTGPTKVTPSGLMQMVTVDGVTTSAGKGALMYVRADSPTLSYLGGQMEVPTPTITITMDLPVATVGSAYTGFVHGTNSGGATGPITVTSTQLPDGLTMTSVGDITGTPLTQGNVAVSFTLTNGTQVVNTTQAISVNSTVSTFSIAPTVTAAATTARISFRADSAANVAIRYGTSSTLVGATTTDIFPTQSAQDFTGAIDIPGLTADTTYYYTPVINGVDQYGSPFPKFKTFPAAGSNAQFSFVFGSCTMHTNVSADTIFDAVPANAKFLLHLGDTIYADRDQPYATTLAGYRGQHRDTLAGADISNARYKALRERLPVFTTWDDHDLANNFSSGTSATIYAPAKQGFQEYQARANPDSMTQGALYYTFQCGNVGFFVLDGRSFRDLNSKVDTTSKTYLGATQKAALKAWLLANKTNFKVKFICSSTPAHGYAANTAGDSWGGVDDGTQAPNGANGFRSERNEIWSYIDDNQIPGVVFLSGDQHWSGSFKTTYNGRPRYEFGASPYNMTNTSTYMLNAVARAADPVNGPVFWKKDKILNMGVVTVDTTVTPATVSYQLYDATGSLGASYLTNLTTTNIDTALVGAPMSLTGTLPSGTVGTPYSSTLDLHGTFVAPVSIDASAGTLPSWMNFSVSGTVVTVTGTPTTAETETFTVRATDSTTGTHQTATAAQSVVISNSAPANYFSPTYTHADITLSNNNSTATRGAAADAWRTTVGVDTHKLQSVYAEFMINKVVNKLFVGIGTSSSSLSNYLGSGYGYGWHSTLGNYYNQAVGKPSSLGTYTDGDIIMVAVKAIGADQYLWFGKNGVWDGDPIAGTGYAYKLINSDNLRIGASMYSATGQVTARVKNSEFTYTAPSGFDSWSGL